MITTAEYFATKTVKELQARAAKLDVAGRSAMKKAELVAELTARMEVCHGKALEIAAEMTAETVSVPVKREAYITVAQLLTVTGWKRLPRKYKKSARAAGLLV
jgi:hypothetical protein